MHHELEFTVSARYLVLPIQNKGNEGNLKLTIDGRTILDYGLALAVSPEKANWYAFFSIERFKGRSACVAVSNATAEGFALVRQSDVIPGAEGFYKEQYRPQFHFSSRTGWLNDPNGMIHYKGVYHLYYQHNPTSLLWGNMTWGHATSTDMVHWREQPKVLFPDARTGTCFSGAAFIDRWNQLGRKTGDDDVLAAFYLRTGIGLCLAYSNDRGQTFTDSEGNPVLTHSGARIDTPRPFWYEPSKRWVAPTYDFFTNEQGERLRAVGFYSSPDLKTWTYESRVEQDKWGDELCGCVDFFQLPVDGDPDKKQWVMILIDGSYIVGTFDGRTFYSLAGKPAITGDRVRSLVVQGNYYATMTFHDAPDGRRVQLTWMQKGGLYPEAPFNQQMSLPSELTLHASPEGPRLRMNPIQELETLRAKTHEWNSAVLKAGENPLSSLKGDLFDLEVEFEPEAGSEAVFDMRGVRVAYDGDRQVLSLCGASTTLQPLDGVVRLRIILDRSSIEVYGNDGRVYIPFVVFPEAENLSVNVTCTRGEVKARYVRVHALKSAWE